MKNKIVTLQDKTIIYIADEIIYHDKKYIYGLQYDKINDTLSGKYYILEIVSNNNNIFLSNIEDINLKNELYKIFTTRQLDEVLK